MINEKVLIIGSGPMAIEYAKVLDAMSVGYFAVCRSSKSARNFTLVTGKLCCEGGIDSWLERNDSVPKKVIVAVGEKKLGVVTTALLKKNARDILVEKPGAFDAAEVQSIAELAKLTDAKVYVGYNRRFYSSVAAAKEIINDDGGVLSFNFDFTERSHIIETLEKESGVKEQWLLSNSTHVIDLAFYLGGEPTKINASVSGSLDWHPAGCIFVGSGETDKGALFSYHANWKSPGGWSLELQTIRHKLLLKPLECLKIFDQKNNEYETVALSELDIAFKPGLFSQVQAYLSNDETALISIHNQLSMLKWFLKIRGDYGSD